MKVKFPLFDNNHNFILQELEVQTVQGLPELKILGLSGQEAQVLKEKLRTSLKFQGFKLTGVRKLIHLKKFDNKTTNFENLEFQLQAMLLVRLKHIFLPEKLSIFFIGKLDLDGKVKPSISEENFTKILRQYPATIFVASSDYNLKHPNLLKIHELKQIKNIHFHNLNPIEIMPLTPEDAKNPPNYIDFESIHDFNSAKFALVLTLKMKGSCLLIGSSGIGKSLIFRTLPSLGILDENIINLDPTFTPNQFKNLIQSLECEDATHKILVLNELSDYKKSFLDYLKIFFDKLDSNSFTHTYSLLASLNPCKCGNLGHTQKQCSCNFYQLQSFENKIPLPVLDRFDIVLNLNSVNSELEFPDLNTLDALSILHSQDNHENLPLDKLAEYQLNKLRSGFLPTERRLSKIVKLATFLSSLRNEEVISEIVMIDAIQINSYLIHKNALQ